MNNTDLLRKVSIIHAAKCKNAAREEVAIASSNKLSELKYSIKTENDNKHSKVIENIEAWMRSEPIVSEQELNIVLNRL